MPLEVCVDAKSVYDALASDPIRRKGSIDREEVMQPSSTGTWEVIGLPPVRLKFSRMIGKHCSCELNWVFDYSRDVLVDNTENIAIGIGSVLAGYPVILGTLLRMWEFSGTTLQSELLQFQFGILLNKCGIFP